jgi:phosphoesterase RecJ-like protein
METSKVFIVSLPTDFKNKYMLKQYLNAQGLTEWNDLVDKASKIVIFIHSMPDGDAMGSSLALSDFLCHKGKNVTVIVPNTYPDFLSWLPGAGNIMIYEYGHQKVRERIAEADLLFCLDFNSLGRLEGMASLVAKHTAPMIMVDHHLNPENVARILVSDSQASSTSELIFCLLMQMEGFEELSKDAAQCIYCGMMTDTGSFTYNSNRSDIFYIISQLLTKGIDKDKIYRAVYHNYSVNRLRLEGYILHDKMEYFEEEHTSVFCLTKEEMKQYQFKKGDAEGFVNLPLQIKGTKLSISLREDTEKPLIRISLRSVDDFSCDVMAKQFFHGGGHLNAAGGSLAMTMDEALDETRRAIEAYHDLLSREVIKD